MFHFTPVSDGAHVGQKPYRLPESALNHEICDSANTDVLHAWHGTKMVGRVVFFVAGAEQLILISEFGGTKKVEKRFQSRDTRSRVALVSSSFFPLLLPICFLFFCTTKCHL